MDNMVKGKVIKGVGGLYTVLVGSDGGELAGLRVRSRARGVLRHGGMQVLAGDEVMLGYDAELFAANRSDEEANFVIESICERKNSLIRPPLANLDYLFITVAAAKPAPVLLTVDKLFSICVYNGIEPIAVITKSELNREYAEEIAEIYRKAGFVTVVTSSVTGEGISELKRIIEELPSGSLSAFSGASGVGKSTIMNVLFPTLSLSTSSVSKKTERGRHTTRETELFVIREGENPVFLADTPGFTMLDFERFDFFGKEDLVNNFIEFEPYIGKCRYTDCTHLSDEDCAILHAISEGKVAKSRHNSYVGLYHVLKNKHSWDKK